jgi:Flp pilus assembly protein TadD
MTDVAKKTDEPAPLLTVALLILTTIALTFADRALAKAELSDSHTDAARFYAAGERLMQQGQNARAVEEFRSAISEERENRNYQLALAAALAAAGQTDDSETALNTVLEKDPAWAEANLALARVLVKEGRSRDATEYYHRAIYGQWSGDPRSSQIAARFELADLLNREGSQEALLSELLPIEQDVASDDESGEGESRNTLQGNGTSGADDIDMRTRLANLFIAAGAPGRADTIFRDLLRADSGNAGFFAGDGEAEFALGNYQRAETQFRAAVRLSPSDAHSQKRLRLCEEILQLNPTSRGLSLNEQYQRSRDLVEYVRNDVGNCLGSNVPVDAQALMKSVDSAKRANTTVEDNLNWANQLWKLRKSECKQPISDDEQAAALVLAMPGNR